MGIQLTREQLLLPLQQISGVVERKQHLPILSTLLVELVDHELRLTGTDTELTLSVFLTLEEKGQDSFTLPARTLMDICRSLPEGALLEIRHEQQEVSIQSGQSKFKLLSLNPQDFPATEEEEASLECLMPAQKLAYLLQHTQYAMAQQDVRYYLNGTLLEGSQRLLRAVAIDGHRMAVAEEVLSQSLSAPFRIILPRKGVSELTRLLGDVEEEVLLKVTRNHFQVCFQHSQFTSKLIDGQYPDHRWVMPKKCDNHMIIHRKNFQQALNRVSVLSTEKFKGVCVELKDQQLKLIMSNSEQEHAEEVMGVSYEGEPFAIGFNVHYLQEALSVMKGESVKMSFSYEGGSVLLEDLSDEHHLHVIMPMRI